MVEVEETRIRKNLGDYYPFQGHYLNVDGHRLHFLDEGDVSKPVLLMVHGNPSWSIYWRKLLSELSEDYRVVVVDHMGCGFSDKPQNYSYTLKQHISNLKKLIEHLNLKKFSLFVHDWGGAIGMGLAGLYPERLESFVIFNSAAFYSPRIPKRIAVCRWPVFGRLAIQGFNAFAGAAVYMATEKGFPRKLKRAYTAPYNSYRNRIATYQFVQDIPMEADHPTRSTLNKVEEGLEKFKRHPIMLVWGDKDWCFNDSFLQTWQEKFPQAEKILLRDSGHYVVEDGFSDYIEPLKRFLSNNLRAKA